MRCAPDSSTTRLHGLMRLFSNGFNHAAAATVHRLLIYEPPGLLNRRCAGSRTQGSSTSHRSRSILSCSEQPRHQLTPRSDWPGLRCPRPFVTRWCRPPSSSTTPSRRSRYFSRQGPRGAESADCFADAAESKGSSPFSRFSLTRTWSCRKSRLALSCERGRWSDADQILMPRIHRTDSPVWLSRGAMFAISPTPWCPALLEARARSFVRSVSGVGDVDQRGNGVDSDAPASTRRGRLTATARTTDGRPPPFEGHSFPRTGESCGQLPASGRRTPAARRRTHVVAP